MLTRNQGAGWTTPFDALLDVSRELDRAFDGGAGPGAWRPLATDVVETADEVRLSMEIPGVRPQDLDITIEDNVLKVSGEKQSMREESEGAAYRLTERRYGRFERRFALPRDVHADACDAAYENGILTVTLPKREEAKPRRVEVRAGESGRSVGPAQPSGN